LSSDSLFEKIKNSSKIKALLKKKIQEMSPESSESSFKSTCRLTNKVQLAKSIPNLTANSEETNNNICEIHSQVFPVRFFKSKLCLLKTVIFFF